VAVEHVFVLMLENRSFDHMLGWSGLRGRDAVSDEPTEVTGLTGSESNDVPGGGRVVAAPGADFVLAVDPGHDFGDVLEQLCGPGATYDPTRGYPSITNSGFASRLSALGRRKGVDVDLAVVMRGFRPDQVPVLHTLASEFAVCDHWFSSLPGPTWPNRFFVHAATSGGLDDSPSPLRSAEAVLAGYRFENGTIYDRLDAQRIPWAVVEGDALPQVLGIAGMIERALQGRFVTRQELEERLRSPRLDEGYVFIEPHYGHVLADGSNFKCGNSQHPLDDVTRGERLLKEVYEAIRRSPHWPNSLLLVLYDEHGGFYDHVAPPQAVPPGDRWHGGDNRHGFAFDRLGVRIPALVISPYTRRGLIDHTVYDHASLLATVEGLWGLEPLTDRDRTANRFDHLLGLPSPRTDAPDTLPAPAVSGVPDCEDALPHRLAGELQEAPSELTVALTEEPALVGFVQVAIARQLHLAAVLHRDVDVAVEEEGERLRDAYRGVRTKFDAARLLHDVQRRYAEVRRG
jgi:phospholipase C